MVIGAICIVIGAVLTVLSGGTFLAGLAVCFGKAILTATIFGAISVGFSALASKILDQPFTFNDALSAFGDGFASGFMFGGLGALGGAAGKLISCESILGSAINITFKVTRVASLGFVGLDILSLVDYAVEPGSNPIADFCSSEGYRTVENVIFGIAAFTGGASKSMTCFVAGTMILTVTGLVAIENIKAGDKVISTDPETFETAEKTVVETYVREDSKLIHLVINDEEIITTETHPFYVTNRGFVNAGELKIGDELLDSNGNVLLVENFAVELTDEPTTVYNFQVEDFHTYYAGQNSILVHNANYKEVNIKNFKIKDKHLKNSSAKRTRKFNVSTPEEANLIVQEALEHGKLYTIIDNGLGSQGQKSFCALIDTGKVIGTKGETFLKIVYDELNNVWTTYPVPTP